MDFNDMKKIWDAQTNTTLYTIDETAMTNVVAGKKDQASHITNTTEILLIVVNYASALFVAGLNFVKHNNNVPINLMALWMFATAVWVTVSRLRRVREGNRFDRSLAGDLRYAITMATYQVRLSLLMRWNMLPIALLVLLGVYTGGKSPWIIAVTALFFLLAFFASRWEHGIYKRKKTSLETLYAKLTEEN